MNFSNKTDLELMQEFDYWKETAACRMIIFTEYYNTDFQERTYGDYQVADRNAQAAYLEISNRGLSYIPEELR